MKLNKTNKKIIDAVIKKAEKVCPNSLALIGVGGSVASGDAYPKSDLDLLVLITDDKGLELTSQFILNDSQIGYDIYCTRWDDLINISQCKHVWRMSKLLDSKIVYVKDDAIYKKLCQLRKKTRQILKSKETLKSAEESLKNAKISYANANLHDKISLVRMDAFDVINDLLNAIMLYNHSYFKRGVKRTLEELKQQKVGQSFISNIKKVSKSKDISEIRTCLRDMILYVEKLTQKKDKPAPLKKVSSQLVGIYEEMYSNWKNKMIEAAKNRNAYSSFMAICSFAKMMDEISEMVDIGKFNILDKYNPDHLDENVKLYNNCLNKYKQVYKRAGIKINEFKNIDEFVKSYLT